MYKYAFLFVFQVVHFQEVSKAGHKGLMISDIPSEEQQAHPAPKSICPYKPHILALKLHSNIRY